VWQPRRRAPARAASDDRLGHPVDRLVTEARGAEQLLCALLGPADDDGRLRASPFERLLDLGADGVRQLGGLVTSLLEQPGRARLGFGDFLGGLLLCFLQGLARLALGRVHHLGALALAFLAVAVDVALALLDIALAAHHFFLRPAKLCGRGGLGIPLDRVGHLGGSPDHVQGIHADRMPGRLDLATLSGGLQHPELDLKLRRVPAEGLERLAHLFAVESVGRARQVLHAGQRRQRWGLRRTSLAFRCHPVSRLLELLPEPAV